jgi:hypothetical protein
LAVAVGLISPARAAAEWQIKPFVGLTFGGGTTFVDLDHAVGTKNVAFGISGVLLGEVIGIEGDLGFGPGFFQAGDSSLILNSGVRTVTANVIVALPRRLAEFTLRPYFVAGMGAMYVQYDDISFLDVFVVSDRLAAFDIGGGATGFLSNHVGVSWDMRHFRGFGGQPKEPGLTQDGANQRLSFWRANMALAVRF